MSAAAILARGNWGQLLKHFGVIVPDNPKKHGPCPICQGKDRFRWDDQNGLGGYICNQCGAGDGFDLVKGATGRQFKEIATEIAAVLGKSEEFRQKQAETEEESQRRYLKRLWDASDRQVEGDLVGVYLKKRVGRLWASNALRLNREKTAMVAKIISHEDRAVNLHLTFLTSEGEKADVAIPKKVMPGKLPDGCAIRLGVAAPRMGVAEGIETAISASILFGIPVWACVNGNLLAKWIPPAIAKQVTVFGDNDASFTGQARSYALANRLAVQFKLDVDVKIPTVAGLDWNDVLMTKF